MIEVRHYSFTVMYCFHKFPTVNLAHDVAPEFWTLEVFQDGKASSSTYQCRLGIGLCGEWCGAVGLRRP